MAKKTDYKRLYKGLKADLKQVNNRYQLLDTAYSEQSVLVAALRDQLLDNNIEPNPKKYEKNSVSNNGEI